MSKEGLEVLARMTDSKIQIREVVDKWILCTYDLPHTDEGDKARARFLMMASAIGATRHTDSVYVLPDSPEAINLALELADTEGGEVIVWGQAVPLNKEKEITEAYDEALRLLLVEISGRLDRMAGYRQQNYVKRVNQMVPKTERLLGDAEGITARRGNEVMALWLELLKQRFMYVTH